MRDALKRINVLYVWIFLVYFTVFTLMPISQHLAKPGWNRVRVYMLLSGLVLLVIDYIDDRRKFFGKYAAWLILMCVAFLVSAIVRYHYNSIDSIYTNKVNLIYYLIQPFLLYATGRRMTIQEKKRFVFSWYTITSIVFIPALCYMFYQFFTLQHYLTGTMNQGWFEGRLFGVMSVLYEGSILVGMLAFFAGYYLYHSRRRIQKVIYSIELLIYIFYLVLSDTRTVFVGCAVGAGFMIYLHCYQKYTVDIKKIFNRGWLIRGSGVFILVILIMFGGIKGIRAAAIYTNWQFHGGSGGTGESNNVFLEEQDRPQQTFSSRRADIWKSYWNIMTDRPSNFIFGTSLFGRDAYIREHYPEAFIVSYYDQVYPQLSLGKRVYDEHNGYLSVWVRLGVLGFIGFIGFLLSCAWNVLSRIRNGNKSSFESMLVTVVLVLLAAAFFEGDICFRYSASSCIFWVFAGFLMNRTETEAGRRL